MKRLLLGIMVVCMFVFVGCQGNKDVVLNKEKLGYDLSACLDMNEEGLLNALQDAGIEIKEEAIERTANYEFHIYSYEEVIFENSYHVTLTFLAYGGKEERRLALYNKELLLTDWPEGKVAESVQKTYEAMVDTYGQPSDTDGVREGEPVCDKAFTKRVGWNTGSYTWRTLEVIYQPFKEMPEPLDYEAKIRIHDESVEYCSEIKDDEF